MRKHGTRQPRARWPLVAACLCVAIGTRRAPVAAEPHTHDTRDEDSGLELELNDELAIGVFSAPGWSNTFIADQLDVEAEVSPAWSLRASAGLTHFLASSQLGASNMSSLGAGASWSQAPSFELAVSLHAAPTVTFTERSPEPGDASRFESSTSALGAELAAEYAAPRAGRFALQLGLALGTTRYVLRERFFDAAASEPESDLRTSLWQAHATLTCSVARAHTELTLAGSFYVYFGAPNAEVSPLLVGGVPFEPVLYALRPGVTQHLGSLELTLHGQYTGYAAALGHSWSAGLETRWSASELLSITAGAELMRASYADASGFALYQASLGVTLAL